MSGSRALFSASPPLVGLALAALCFIATGGRLSTSVLLSALIVPTGVRAYRILSRQHASGEPISLATFFGVLLVSGALTIAIGIWLIVTILVSHNLWNSDLSILVPFCLGGLLIWLAILRSSRSADHSAKEGTARSNWRQAVRVRFTIKEMLIGIACVAFLMWPVHLLRMQPRYREIASYEGMLARLCLNESELMADRARQCRLRAVANTAWDLDDEVSEILKICPYPSDGPGRSWLHQAEIWDRAAELARLAAQRHHAKSGWYSP